MVTILAILPTHNLEDGDRVPKAGGCSEMMARTNRQNEMWDEMEDAGVVDPDEPLEEKDVGDSDPKDPEDDEIPF